jgi:hypothetical protein
MRRNDRTSSGDGSVASGLIFLGFVVVGCLYIIFSKRVELHILLVTSIPIVVMLGYAGLSFVAPFLRLRDDQTGDNLYYMGFLFTLTSLGVSLFQFSVDAGAENIVRNFGIAITSTIAGIALRVFFSQMRRDPVEVERAGRLELAEASRRVRRELDATVMEMNQFRRAAQQAALEGFDEIASKLIANLEDYAGRASGPIKHAAESSSTTLETMTKTMTESLERSARRLSEESERVAAGAGSISQALDDVSTRLSAMQTPDRVIEVQIEPIASSLREIMEEHARRSDANAAQLRDVMMAIERFQNEHEGKLASLEAAVPAMERAVLGIEAAARSLEAVSEEIAGRRKQGLFSYMRS